MLSVHSLEEGEQGRKRTVDSSSALLSSSAGNGGQTAVDISCIAINLVQWCNGNWASFAAEFFGALQNQREKGGSFPRQFFETSV